MRGFDTEFRDLDHYIRVITDRIWEGRQIERIRDYYSEGCVVETPSITTVGVEAVIKGTRDTLLQFPDRRLLAEDVVVSGDENGGFLSSHRIFSPMTHAGPGVFGQPTFQTVFARTIADCVCKENRIIHEWLVRDQSAIARNIGIEPQDLALQWLGRTDGHFTKEKAPKPPQGYFSHIGKDLEIENYVSHWRSFLLDDKPREFLGRGHDPIIAAVPGGKTIVGGDAVSEHWTTWKESWEAHQFVCEHAVINRREDRHDTLAARWRAHATYKGNDPRATQHSKHEIEIMAICHADLIDGQLIREWVLIDEVALWMQILSH